MGLETEIIDKLFLELSQVTTAETSETIELKKKIEACREGERSNEMLVAMLSAGMSSDDIMALNRK